MHALIGRGDELRRIAVLAGAATVGAPTVLLIEGPPGSGRTRLLEETARLARRRGVTVLAEPEWAGAAGSRRLLDTAGDGPLLFVADHPGRVDPRAWPVLELLAEKRAVVVVVSGGGVPYLPTAVVHRIRLGPLTAAAQAEFVAHLTGARPDPQLTDLCRVAAGRPAALRELLTGLGEDGLLRVEAGRATVRAARLPRRAEEHLRGLVASVSAPARHLLQAAATIGVSFPLARLARLMGVGPITLLPAIEEAVESGLLAGDGELLAFGHELVRAVVESTLPRPVAAALRGDPPRRPVRPLPLSGRSVRPVPPPRREARPGPVDWAALSPREQEIADLVGQALTNRQIARRTAISPHTVNFHLRQIFQKLGLVSRVELVALWHQRMASAGSREAPPSSS